MIQTTANACLIALTLAMLGPLYRVIRGPSVADRVVGTDALASCIMCIIIVFEISRSSRHYIEAVMAIAILGFFGTVAIARYLIRGRPID